MATISDDVVEGSRVGVDTNGWYENRVKKVTGLATGSARQNITQAVVAVIAAVGNVGSTHPELSGPVINNIYGEASGDDVVTVTVVYRQTPSTVDYPAGWDWGDVGYQYEEVGASMEYVDSATDYRGQAISVSFNGRSQYGVIRKGVPRAVRMVRQVEKNSPLEKAKTYVATTSDGGTWLCTAILGRKNQTSGAFAVDKWDVTYEFAFSETGWEQEIQFKDEHGRPHPGISPGNGIATVQAFTERGRPV